MSATALPTQSSDFPAWYGEVVRRAGLAENSAVRGAMVIKPYGYAIWETIQRELDDRIKATGHENVYFPLFVPASVLAQEGELVEGFAPEVAVVTEAGGKRLEEPLAVRPTSEALIWSTYARWVQSYRDLPLLYNQWANVVRWELRPRLFLRTSEFLWQEGHTAHETEAEAVAETLTILHDVYAETVEEVLAIPVLRGRKSASERFPGAVDTYTLEALMRDGKALQAATSHYLGQGFARAFGVRFTGRDGGEQFPYATSWGATTRLVGAVVMAHGDDRGLRLPPRLAPTQVVVVPIGREDERGHVLPAAWAVADELRAAGVRVRVDDRPEHRPGFKFNEWELKGVPLRVELGARDLESGTATVARRDTGDRQQLPLAAGLPAAIAELLRDIQASLFRTALAERERRTLSDPGSYDDLAGYLRAGGGFAAAPWCGSPECEARVKADTSATIRCLPLGEPVPEGACICCGRSATATAVWAQAYSGRNRATSDVGLKPLQNCNKSEDSPVHDGGRSSQFDVRRRTKLAKPDARRPDRGGTRRSNAECRVGYRCDSASSSSRRSSTGRRNSMSSSTNRCGAMSVTPRSRNHWQRRCTSLSGADAPEVIPTARTPSSHASSISVSSSMRYALTPSARETSTSRCEFDELREPITSSSSISESISLTAHCRLDVA
jgi:prolyl-tRNA synthetase